MERNQQEQASWWHVITFSWLTSTLEQGRTQPLRRAAPLPEPDNTLRHGADFVQAEPGTSPLYALMWHYRKLLAVYAVVDVLLFTLHLYQSAYIMKQILVFQELNRGEGLHDNHSVSGGVAAIGLFCLVEAFRIVVGVQLTWWASRIGLRMTASLATFVVHRSLSRRGPAAGASTTSRSAHAGKDGGDGAVFNVVNSDIGTHVTVVWVLLGLWSWPYKMVTAALVLYSQVGNAALPGLVAMVILHVLFFAMDVLMGYLRAPYFEARDTRLSRLSEAFVNVRTLRINGWQAASQAHIQDARDGEMRVLAAREYTSHVSGALHYVNQAILTLVVLYFMLQSSNAVVKASVIIPLAAVLMTLNGPVGAVSGWARALLEFRNASARLRDYITVGIDSPIAAPGRALVSVNAEFQPERRPEQGMPIGRVRDEEALPLHGFRLRAALELYAGQVAVVVGPSASGKSLLLEALLGEVPCVRGVVRAPGQFGRMFALPGNAHALHAGTETLPYPSARHPLCPQQPWLFSGTVKANILFGRELDAELYGRVLKACALEHDLQTFAEGDETEIGSATVSGGQKVRIALARVVYAAMDHQEPALVLIDDVFRALNAEVALHVTTSLVGPGGLLRQDRLGVLWAAATIPVGVPAGTRVLTLSAGDIVEDRQLTEADVGTGVAGPNPQDEMEVPRGNRDSREPGGLGLREPRRTSDPEVGVASDAPMMLKPGTVKLYEKEKAEEGLVQWSSYMYYFDLVGHGTMFALFVLIGGIMISQQMYDLFIAYWTDERNEDNFLHPWLTQPIGPMGPIVTNHDDNDSMFRIYCTFFGVFCFFNFSGFLIEVYGGLRAARSAFNKAVEGSLSRPLIWWDQNPTGRLLNRFLADQDVVDNTITRIFGVITGAVYYLIGHSIFLCVVNPFAIFVLIPTIVLMETVAARLYRPNIRELTRLELVSRSPYCNEIVEALRGQATIRAFGAQDVQTCRVMLALADAQKVQFLKFSLNAWLSIRLSTISFALTLTSTLYPVMQYAGLAPIQSAGLVGFAITYSQQLEGILNQLIHNFSEMEMQMVSLERLRELSSGKPDTRIPLRVVGKELTVQNLGFRYRPELRYALHNLSFTVPAGQKVAVLGRTGAGKSSLLLCLLNQVPFEGAVLLGGQPTTKYTVYERIGLVPQEAVLFAGSVRFNLDPQRNYPDSVYWGVLRKVGLAARFDTLDDVCGVLSAAERQLLSLARVLLRDLSLVLLDEVTSFLSAEASHTVMETLWGTLRDQTVLMVTHSTDLAETWCSRALHVQEGRLVEDRPI